MVVGLRDQSGVDAPATQSAQSELRIHPQHLSSNDQTYASVPFPNRESGDLKLQNSALLLRWLTRESSADDPLAKEKRACLGGESEAGERWWPTV